MRYFRLLLGATRGSYLTERGQWMNLIRCQTGLNRLSSLRLVLCNLILRSPLQPWKAMRLARSVWVLSWDLRLAFTFGSGVTSACFQTDGNFCSLYDELRMSAIGWYSSSAYSFKNQLDGPSGPGALCLFRCNKFPWTRSGVASRNTGLSSNGSG